MFKTMLSLNVKHASQSINALSLSMRNVNVT